MGLRERGREGEGREGEGGRGEGGRGGEEYPPQNWVIFISNVRV